MPRRKTQVQTTPAPAQPTTPTKAFLYLLFPRASGGQIDEKSVNKVKEVIKNATLKELYLVVDSPGGDAYSAVKIIRILRSKFTKIIGLVPFRAMSAATLMLLGANEIYMCEESQLGPLDLQIEHPIDGSTISSVDVVDTLNNLSAAVMNNASSMFETMRDNLGNGEKIGKHEAMKLALHYSTELTKPIAQQIDPYHRQRAMRTLKIAHWYAYDLLRTGMMSGKADQSWKAARYFVYGFPDHSYAIFKEEAMGYPLYLTIQDSTTYPNWANLCSEVETYLKSSVTQVISYVEK